MRTRLLSVFIRLNRIFRSLAIRVLPQELINPRIFSNLQLRKYANLFSGEIVNVSGWDDRDGENGQYRDYFSKCTSYTVTNAPTDNKGFGSLKESNVRELQLDLTLPLAPALIQKFDVVFNHTTLEHIFEIEIAFANLCAMSRDAVILVVPVLQQVHISRSFGDYWRPTTLAVAKLFRKNGFEPLVIIANDQPFYPVYCFAIAVRNAKEYEGKITTSLNFEMGGALFGSSLKERPVEPLIG